MSTINRSGKTPFTGVAYSTITDSDLKTQCPSCFSDNSSHVGHIETDNSTAPTYKCSSCNTLYSKPAEGGVKVLVDNIVSADGSSGGAFFPTSTTAGSLITDGTAYNETMAGPINATITSPVQLDYDSKSKLDRISDEVDNLTCSILNLMDELKKMTKTNNELMNKLATDPLANVRKKINEFNLK